MVRFFIYLTAFSFLSAICKAEISTYYQLNLTDWPTEIRLSLENEVREIKDNQLTPEKLNQLLKKLDTTFRFNSLKLIAGSKPFELRLVGEISTQIESIEFQGLSDLSEGEALLLMNLYCAVGRNSCHSSSTSAISLSAGREATAPVSCAFTMILSRIRLQPRTCSSRITSLSRNSGAMPTMSCRNSPITTAIVESGVPIS